MRVGVATAGVVGVRVGVATAGVVGVRVGVATAGVVGVRVGVATAGVVGVRVGVCVAVGGVVGVGVCVAVGGVVGVGVTVGVGVGESLSRIRTNHTGLPNIFLSLGVEGSIVASLEDNPVICIPMSSVLSMAVSSRVLMVIVLNVSPVEKVISSKS